MSSAVIHPPDVRHPAGDVSKSSGRSSDGTASGIAIRAGIVFAALVFLMHPYVLGPWARNVIALLDQPIVRLLGLTEYPLQGGLVFRVVASILGGAGWWALQRDRLHEREMFRLLLVVVRFVLAAALIGYGLAKVLHVQFPWPNPADWIRPLREMTPLHYVGFWTGASLLHETAIGLTELLAGVCLLFRRTTTLGALIGLLTVGNTVAIAVSFDDIRVGSYWVVMELAGMALLLILVDLKRVAAFFAHEDRVTQPAVTHYTWSLSWVRRVERIAKPAFLTGLLVVNAPTVVRAYDAQHRSSIFGAYTVEELTLDGQSIPPERGGERWRLVAIDNCRRFAIRTIDERQLESAIVYEGAAESVRQHRDCAEATAAPTGMLTLAAPSSPLPGLIEVGPAGALRYSRLSPDELKLEGELEDGRIVARLRRIPDRNFAVTVYPNFPQ